MEQTIDHVTISLERKCSSIGKGAGTRMCFGSSHNDDCFGASSLSQSFGEPETVLLAVSITGDLVSAL